MATRILFVDRFDSWRPLVRYLRTFDEREFDFVVANDDWTAIDAIGENDIDLVVTAITLRTPLFVLGCDRDTRGLNVVETAKTRGIPVIVFSGDSRGENLQRARMLGADAIIEKGLPGSHERLRRTIDILLDA